MELTRPAWTDERLDDLNAQVAEMRGEAREFRREVQREFGGVHREFGSVRGEIIALQRPIIQVGCGLIGTLVVGILGLIGTQL